MRKPVYRIPTKSSWTCNNLNFAAAINDDLIELNTLFDKVIRNNFHRDQIDQEMNELMLEEIENQKSSLSGSFNLHNNNLYYKLTIDHTICGVIAYGNAGELITNHLAIPADIPEIKSVMILPEYHHQGLGSIIFEKVITNIKEAGLNGYCLDCGYRCSQGFWIKKLGDPDVCLKDFWGEGYDHMIWIRMF